MWNKDRLIGLPMPDLNDEDWYQEPMGLFESAKTSFQYHAAAHAPNAGDALPDEIDKRNFQIQQFIDSGDVDPKNWLLPDDRWTANTSAAMKGFGGVDFGSMATALHEQGYNIETDEQIQARLRETVANAQEQADRPGSTAGKLAGVIGAELIDPYNIAFGAAAVFTGNALNPSVLNRFGKLFRTGQLAAEGALTEAATTPMRRQSAQFYGHDYGVKEATIDITAGAIGLPVLDGIMKLGSKALVQPIKSKVAAFQLRKNFPGSPTASKIADTLDMFGDQNVEEAILASRAAEKNINDPPRPVFDEEELAPGKSPDVWTSQADPIRQEITDFDNQIGELNTQIEQVAAAGGEELPELTKSLDDLTAQRADAEQRIRDIEAQSRLIDQDETWTPEMYEKLDADYQAARAKDPDLPDYDAEFKQQQEYASTIQACITELGG